LDKAPRLFLRNAKLYRDLFEGEAVSGHQVYALACSASLRARIERMTSLD
jgi:hypothetical protein